MFPEVEDPEHNTMTFVLLDRDSRNAVGTLPGGKAMGLVCDDCGASWNGSHGFWSEPRCIGNPGYWFQIVDESYRPACEAEVEEWFSTGAYLGQCWLFFAAAAWTQFERFGRGAILLNQAANGWPEGWSYLKLADAEAMAREVGDVEVADAVATCDPEREIVFLRVAPAGHLLYAGSGGAAGVLLPFPPKAAARRLDTSLDG